MSEIKVYKIANENDIEVNNKNEHHYFTCVGRLSKDKTVNPQPPLRKAMNRIEFPNVDNGNDIEVNRNEHHCFTCVGRLSKDKTVNPQSPLQTAMNSVKFHNVGNGNAIEVDLNGTLFFIDAGHWAEDEESNVENLLTQKYLLECFYLTHWHKDHYNIALANPKFKFKHMVYPAITNNKDIVSKLLKKAMDAKIGLSSVELREAPSSDLNDSGYLYILLCDAQVIDVNNVQYHIDKMIFPGDCTLSEIPISKGPSYLIAVPHHGSKQSNNIPTIPSEITLAVFSCNKKKKDDCKPIKKKYSSAKKIYFTCKYHKSVDFKW